jgi:hypothetical protein
MAENSNNEIKNTEANSKHPSWLPWENALGMLLAGLGLGWIIGMSQTPIIRDVILAFIAVITTVMGLIAGFGGSSGLKDGIFSFFMGTEKSSETDDNKEEINQKIVRLIPIGIFLLCLSIGSAAGLYTKNNYWFGSNYKKMASELGISDSIFYKKYNTQIFEAQIASNQIDSLTVMDSLHIYQTFELVYGKPNNENVTLLKAITDAGNKKHFPKIGPGFPGLMNDKVKINDCNDASHLSPDMLKDWLLKKVSAKNKARIEAIDFNDEAKLMLELKKLCPNLK